MKKIVSLVLSLMLVLLCVGVAEETASVTTETYADSNAFAVNEATLTEEQLANFQEAIEVADEEIVKLAVAETLEAYFGGFTDKDGNALDIAALLETETLNVNEFCPVVVPNAEDVLNGEDSAVITLRFLTPYEVGQKVIVAIGLTEGEEIAWTMYEGEGIEPEADLAETEGRISVELDADMITKIAEQGYALLAIISK